MTPQELEQKFVEGAQQVSFWSKAHGKATAVILSIVVGLIVGYVLFHSLVESATVRIAAALLLALLLAWMWRRWRSRSSANHSGPAQNKPLALRLLWGLSDPGHL